MSSDKEAKFSIGDKVRCDWGYGVGVVEKIEETGLGYYYHSLFENVDNSGPSTQECPEDHLDLIEKKEKSVTTTTTDTEIRQGDKVKVIASLDDLTGIYISGTSATWLTGVSHTTVESVVSDGYRIYDERKGTWRVKPEMVEPYFSVGEEVEVKETGKRGTVTRIDDDSLPYKVNYPTDDYDYYPANQLLRVRKNETWAETASRDTAERQIEEFKKKIRKRAKELTDEHGWCSVVQDALDEIGIGRFSQEGYVDITLRVPVDTSDYDSFDEWDFVGWVENSNSSQIRDTITGISEIEAKE